MVIRNLLKILFLSVVLILTSAAQAHGNQHKVKAAQVFLDAANRTDLSTPGSPPFELRAGIKFNIRGNLLSGTYLLLWKSKNQWREEVALPGYQRVSVGTADGTWLYRNLKHEIPWAADLDYALEFTTRLRWSSKRHPGKLRSRRLAAVDLRCSRLVSGRYVQEVNDFSQINNSFGDDFCFEPQQPVLRAELFPKGASWPPNISSIEYSHFAPFGTKTYPWKIYVKYRKQTFLTVSVKRIAPLVRSPASEFMPPSHAIFEATCDSPVQLKPTKEVRAAYPPKEMASWHMARVILYILVEPDGTVHNAAVAFPATPDFDAAALAAVRQWRFRPKSCNGKPTATETYVIFDFGRRQEPFGRFRHSNRLSPDLHSQPIPCDDTIHGCYTSP